MYAISYCALGLLALMLVGMVAYDVLARLRRGRPKRLWECVVILVFVVGMLESMAVKPGSRGGESAPGAHSATGGIVARQYGPSGVSTNAVPPWEVGFAFRSFVWTPSNVVAELAWPSGFFSAPVKLDVLAAFPTPTNDWRWIGSESVPSGTTNLTFAVSSEKLDLSAMPEALFFRVAERIGFNSNMDDFDGDGLPNLYELHHDTNPYVPDAALAPRLSVGTPGGYGSLKDALAASSAFSIVMSRRGTIRRRRLS